MGKGTRQARGPQTTDEKIDEKIRELRQATREANEAIRGLREIMTELIQFRSTFPNDARGIFDQVANAALKSYTDDAVEGIKRQQAEIEEGIAKRIKTIMAGLSERRFRTPSVEEVLAAERVIEWMRDGDPVTPGDRGALVNLVNEYRERRTTTGPDPLRTLTPLPPPNPKTPPAL